MSRKLPLSLAGLAMAGTLLGQGAALAHHSFAVFFDDKKNVKIHGTVTSFRFTNPHATIVLQADNGSGKVQEWRVETNAPVVLQRRGWNRDSLHAGDVVTIEGWPSRDGKPYMRLRQATGANGKPIGLSAFGTTDN